MEKKFKKVLGGWDVIVVAFGAMIGWGWVVSSGSWIQTGGVIGTLIGFIIGGVMIYFVGLTYAELTTSIPKCGGEHTFSYMAFGPIGSFICTWSLILSYVGVVCFEAVSLPAILQYIFPNFQYGYMYTIAGYDVYLSWVLVAVAFCLLIIIINIVGTKKAAVFQKILTIFIALVGVLLLIGSISTGNYDNILEHSFNNANNSNALINILKVAIMTPFFFFGFDVIPQAAEEINVPAKKLGKLMLLSIVLAVVFYVMIVFSIGLVMNSADLSVSMNTSGLVAADAMTKAFNSDIMAKILIIGGLCGIITSWNSFLIGGSRAIYSMSEAYMIPHTFSKLTVKQKTPLNAIILIGILSIISPFLGKAMLTWIVNAANFACCLAYCIVAVSFLTIRKKFPNIKRPFKIKRFKVIGIIAVVMSGIMCLMYIIPGTICTLIWQEWIIVGGWIILGMIFIFWSKNKYKNNFAKINIEDIE